MMYKQVVFVFAFFVVFSGKVFAAPVIESERPRSETSFMELDFYNKNDLEFARELGNINGSFIYTQDFNFNEEVFTKIVNSYDAKKNFEVELTETPVEITGEIIAPISNCLFSTEGSGGSIDYTYQFSITAGASLSWGLEDAILGIVELSGGFSVSKTISFGITYSCSVNKGGVGQILVIPKIAQVTARHREVLTSPITGRKKIGSWTKPYDITLPMSDSGPTLMCANVTSGVLLCNIPPNNITLPSNNGLPSFKI
ncbi:hypothetical protein PACTADRAFT_1994 [Pachysolen tannophilus NRRL Y-2460]|uniref:Uncharacterized protein n=1 Tax=Pachysolen tannophilus NRRL Y-2460 TaxID=669874 RepID=A0A1E4U0B4_PACTA|nr:hypothetical protein PACTADRAFT_1994 [Pachysolen tannophilus NRRL Y-2460]